MNDKLYAVLGVGAAVLNVVATVPYILDILRGKTKPERATWWIWATLLIVILAAQWHEGASWAMAWTATTILLMLIIGVLSVRYGYGHMARRDYLSSWLH